MLERWRRRFRNWLCRLGPDELAERAEVLMEVHRRALEILVAPIEAADEPAGEAEQYHDRLH